MSPAREMSVTDSDNAFEEFERKLLRVAEMFKQIQSERRALQEELDKLSADLKERTKRLETLDREIQTLRRERDDVRDRIEKLLTQVDVLTKSGPEE